MKMVIACVKDRATDAYGTPMFLVSVGQGMRSFSDEVNRESEENQLFRHPDDFDLYELGEYDTDSGSFDCFVPRLLARGKDISTKIQVVK